MPPRGRGRKRAPDTRDERGERGGRRQRVAAAGSTAPEPTGPEQLVHACCLVLGLLKKWAMGFISAPFVQEMCHLSWLDEQRRLHDLNVSGEQGCHVLKRFAMMGKEGKHPQNMQRAIKTFLGDGDVPRPKLPLIHMNVRIDRASGYTVRGMPLPMLAPHELVSYLYNNYKNRFNDIFYGESNDESALKRFWDQVESRGDPRLKEHPMLGKANWKQQSVPISFLSWRRGGVCSNGEGRNKIF